MSKVERFHIAIFQCSDVSTTKHGFMADFDEIFAKLIVTSSSMILSHWLLA